MSFCLSERTHFLNPLTQFRLLLMEEIFIHKKLTKSKKKALNIKNNVLYLKYDFFSPNTRCASAD